MKSARSFFCITTLCGSLAVFADEAGQPNPPVRPPVDLSESPTENSEPSALTPLGTRITAKQAFARLDVDEDGRVTAAEFRRSPGMADLEHAAEMVAKIDADGNGSLSFSEFNVVFAKRHAGQASTDWPFKLNDGNPWKTDEHTRKSVQRMQGLVDEGQPETLGQALAAEIHDLFKGCTLEGEAHEQLHLFLGELMVEINGLYAARTPDARAEAIPEIAKILAAFDTYFD